MPGNENVIAELNAALSAELTAIVQYMTQSEMCQNWGYKRLGELTKGAAGDGEDEARGRSDRAHYLPRQHTHMSD